MCNNAAQLKGFNTSPKWAREGRAEDYRYGSIAYRWLGVLTPVKPTGGLGAAM